MDETVYLVAGTYICLAEREGNTSTHLLGTSLCQSRGKQFVCYCRHPCRVPWLFGAEARFGEQCGVWEGDVGRVMWVVVMVVRGKCVHWNILRSSCCGETNRGFIPRYDVPLWRFLVLYISHHPSQDVRTRDRHPRAVRGSSIVGADHGRGRFSFFFGLVRPSLVVGCGCCIAH